MSTRRRGTIGPSIVLLIALFGAFCWAAERDVDDETRGGQTPLHIAAQAGNAEQVRRILQNEPELSARDAEGWTPLHRAADGRHSEAVRLLLEAGADPDLLSAEERQSALHLARNNVDIIRLLLEHGADPNVRGWGGQTPLHQRVEMGDLEGTRVLLAGGADPNVPDDEARTALHYAVVSRWTRSLEVAGALVEGGADPLAFGPDGHSPLFVAVRRAAAERFEQALIDRGDHPGFVGGVDRTGRSLVALFLESGVELDVVIASMLGDIDRVEELLEATPESVDELGEGGVTPLFAAALVGDAEAAMALLDHGADVNVPTDRGQTALHAASAIESHAIAAMLLGRGADPNAADAEGNTPLHSAFAMWPRQVRYAVWETKWSSGIPQAGPYTGVPFVRLLLDAGADPDAATPEGWTPLLLAVSHRERAESVTALLEGGADPNLADWMGQTPLHNAGTAQIAEALLAHGAAVNAVDESGDTALHIAAARCEPDQVKVLLAHGADVNAAGGGGNRPLHKAAARGTPMFMGWGDPGLAEVIDTLLRHGADPRARNDAGQTPLDVARARGDRSVVLYLERRLGVR